MWQTSFNKSIQLISAQGVSALEKGLEERPPPSSPPVSLDNSEFRRKWLLKVCRWVLGPNGRGLQKGAKAQLYQRDFGR